MPHRGQPRSSPPFPCGLLPRAACEWHARRCGWRRPASPSICGIAAVTCKLSPRLILKLRSTHPARSKGSALDYATCNVACYCSGVRFAHKGLRRFYERGDVRGLNAAHVARVRRLLTALQDASSPQDMALPGCRLHQLTGDRSGQWSVRASGNWRIVFRFVDGVAVDVDLIDYH